MKKFRKMLADILLFACGMAFAVPGHAGYRLSDEVKKPTPALLEASEIGVRVFNNKAMQDLPDKDALVVMSFGTTMKETRDKTINATLAEIRNALPDVKVVVAYTSHIIIDRIKAKEGIAVPTPAEALEQLKEEGYTRIALASLDIIPGMEYDYKCGIYRNYRNQFKKMTMGLPLLFWQGQEDQRDDVAETVEAFATQFPDLAGDEALLVMTHGTPHPSNAFYAVIQDRLKGGFCELCLVGISRDSLRIVRVAIYRIHIVRHIFADQEQHIVHRNILRPPPHPDVELQTVDPFPPCPRVPAPPAYLAVYQ